MTQILVTIDERDAPAQSIRRAIAMLKGVVSTSVYAPKSSKKAKQEQYVKQSLESAFEQVRRAGRGEEQLKTADQFLEELLADSPA